MKKEATTSSTKQPSCMPFLHLAISDMIRDKGLRQVDITSVSESYMSRIARGEKHPTIERLEHICHHCGVDMCEFFAVYMKPLMSPKK